MVRSLAATLGASVVAAALAVSATNCGCTQAGCFSGTTVRVATTLDRSALSGGTITACRNDACAEAALDDGPSFGAAVAALRFDGTLEPWPSGVVVQLTVHSESLSVGDRYVVRVRDASGALLVERMADLTRVERVEPNGPVCGPSCDAATLEL